VVGAGRDGPTSAANGQGLCAACNQAKEASGWSARVVADGLSEAGRARRHRVRLRTPTGHTYDSTAPPLLEARRASPDFSWVEHALEVTLAAA
jgi:hypothetical protein